MNKSPSDMELVQALGLDYQPTYRSLVERSEILYDGVRVGESRATFWCSAAHLTSPLTAGPTSPRSLLVSTAATIRASIRPN